jgi:hypothetical protein
MMMANLLRCVWKWWGTSYVKKKKLISSISLSQFTVSRRIDDISQMTETKLHDLSQKFEAFSIAVDESTNVVDTAELAIFIRGVDIYFKKKTEELAALCSMKGSITGTELYEQIMSVTGKFNPNLSKLQGITTDAALAMVGKKNGLTALIMEEMEKRTRQASHLVLYHCIIHQESLYSKAIKMNHVMNTAVSTVNFIQSHSLNNRQF